MRGCIFTDMSMTILESEKYILHSISILKELIMQKLHSTLLGIMESWGKWCGLEINDDFRTTIPSGKTEYINTVHSSNNSKYGKYMRRFVPGLAQEYYLTSATSRLHLDYT